MHYLYKDEKERKNISTEYSSYFQEALSNFTQDAASGRAIRHLVDAGYTTKQIMNKLDYPTPQSQVEKTVYRYMKEQHILLESLPIPENTMQTILIKNPASSRLYACLQEYIRKDGEDFSYISCPFGSIRRDRDIQIQRLLSCLTSREKDYILGIPWGKKIMYHQLNRRMLEIGVQLTLASDTDFTFYFLKSQVRIQAEVSIL